MIGLARDPAEWAWSYLMLIGYAILFLSIHSDRVLGLDGLLCRRVDSSARAKPLWARVLDLIS